MAQTMATNSPARLGEGDVQAIDRLRGAYARLREGKVARLFVGGGPQLPDNLRDALSELLPDQR